MATRIIHSKKAVQFAIYKNGNGNETLGPLQILNLRSDTISAISFVYLCINQ